MLNRLILKVTKFQLPPPKRLGTVVKNILGGHHAPPPQCQIGSSLWSSTTLIYWPWGLALEVLVSFSILFFNQKQSGKPGSFDGKAHRGTRWHSMQGFGCPFCRKNELRCNWPNRVLYQKELCSCYFFIEMKCILVKFLTYVFGSSMAEILKLKIQRSQFEMM